MVRRTEALSSLTPCTNESPGLSPLPLAMPPHHLAPPLSVDQVRRLDLRVEPALDTLPVVGCVATRATVMHSVSLGQPPPSMPSVAGGRFRAGVGSNGAAHP
jgi:hypothetical protein